MSKLQSAHSQSLLSAVSYGTVAIAANFINKSAIQTFPFAPNTILLLQLLAMFATTQCLRSSACLSFPAFSTARCWQLLPLSLAYVAHASMVLRSLLYLNVAIYNTLKRLTPVLVLLFKAFHEWKAPGTYEVACVCLIVSGCIVAGAGDLSYSASGYAAALLCACLQAVYILLAEAKDSNSHAAKQNGFLDKAPMLVIQPTPLGSAPGLKTGSADEEGMVSHISAGEVLEPSRHKALLGSGLEEPMLTPSRPALSSLASSCEVLYYTALSAIPFLCLAVALTNEPAAMSRMAEAMQPEGATWHGSAAWSITVMWAETALAGTLMWCTECNNGLTTSIVGVLKGVVAVVLGFFFMAGSARVTVLNVVGVSMVLAGGTWYSSMQCYRKSRLAR